MNPASTPKDAVLYELRDHVAVITMNMPEQKNGWTLELQEAFFDRLDQASADTTARAVVVTGAGRMFCPGGSIDDLSRVTGSGIPIKGSRPITYPLTVGKPLIAAINGGCAGFGFVLAAMCDIRFAAKGAKLTTAFARRGVAAEHTITYLLPRQVGLQRALDLLMSGRVMESDEAERIGFVLKVTDADKVVNEACRYGAELAKWSSPSAMWVIRKQIYEDLDHDFETARIRSLDLMVRSSKWPDFAEGIASFAERREPSFSALPPDFSIDDD